MDPSLRYAKGIFELIKWFLVAAFGLVLINYFLFSFFVVSGPSMEPNLHDKDLVLVNRIVYKFTDPKRGDLVVVKYPGNPDNTYYVKRVIAVGGETLKIQGGAVSINGKVLAEPYLTDVTTEPDMTITVPAGSFATLGDNRPVSSDSRVWGPAEKRFILGQVVMSILPGVSVYPRVIY